MRTPRPRPGTGTPTRVDFASGASTCAASLYVGCNGAAVVMASGLGVTRGPGTDRHARAFHAAGFTVVAFDYRRFGDSGGEPRHVVKVREQLEDWKSAIGFAQGVLGVDPSRVALWGFSLGGGHVIRVAAERSDVAGAIAQAPTADGMAAARNAMRFAPPRALLGLSLRGVRDAFGAVFGAPPVLVPAAGEPGDMAMVTTPDAMDAARALDPEGRYDEWDGRVAARFALTSVKYRPGKSASSVGCPLLVVVYDDDTSAPPGPAARAAERAPNGELVRRPGNHYAGFLDDFDQTIRIEVAFLQQHLVDGRSR